jgi:hypothetical protein
MTNASFILPPLLEKLRSAMSSDRNLSLLSTFEISVILADEPGRVLLLSNNPIGLF